MEGDEENPSAGRVAGWSFEMSEFGVFGVLFAIVVGIWARRRSRKR